MPLHVKYRHSTGWTGLPEIHTPLKRPPTPDILRPKNTFIPTSLENARRRAMILIHSTEKDVQCFKDKHFRNARNTFGIETDDLIRYVHEKTGKQARAKDYKEFDQFLSRCRTTASLVQKDELDKMDVILKRTSAFDVLVEKSKEKLEEAFNDYVDKYCLSFASEAQNREINCVHEYENNIVEWRRIATDTLAALEDILRQYAINCGDSFEDFKRHYDNILHCMRSALKMFPRIANALKNWITADEAYPRKLHDQANALMVEKLNKIKEVREQQLRAGYAQHQLKHKDYSTTKIVKRLNQTIESKRYFRKKEVALSEKQQRLELSVAKKQKEMETLYEEHYFEQPDSPSTSNNILLKISIVQDEIIKLQKTLESAKKNLNNTKNERKVIEKDVHRLQKLRDNSIKSEKFISKEAIAREEKLKSNHHENRELRNKIECLKRIRSIKLHPDTLKKIFAEGYTPGKKFEITDGFGDACKIAAAHIGYKWPLLYLELPFQPARDTNLRNQDIEAFDIAGQKRDLRTKDVALRSLAKWKRLNSKATVYMLLSSLRLIGAGKIAHRIEKQRLSTK
ncbi:hypothetical protein SNE40_003605 [Patella caerulea]|uniref:Death domain-containing protein n=1 Tax=Patella caerulea TaxID=87958 RepID=A0AAN8KEG0_PATCE